MKKKKTFQAFLLVLMPFLLTSCFVACSWSDSDETAYYDVEGEGYVVDTAGNPAPLVQVGISAYFPSHPWATKESVREFYTTDVNGYFRLRFLKCKDGEDVESYRVYTCTGKNEDGRNIYPNNVKISKTTIQIDTLYWNLYN
jgi:hypothetical protein